jgi:mannose/cellobiose epimerase-like protein (N-acyl-D-glucosamine 2-epimerase family)
VRQRLHWVLCEALGAATALWSVTGEAAYRDLYATWWDYADRYLIDRVDGSWHHELDVANRPAETIKPGKADVYHALQATLLPRLELGPAVASSLAAGP